MKLDDIYTEKQLIYNSPISDICKAKPVNRVIDNDDDSTDDSTWVCLKIVDVDFKIPPHSIRREIEAIKRLQPHKGIVHYIKDFQIIDDVILVERYYAMNLSQLINSERYCKKRIKYNLNEPSEQPKCVLTNIINPIEIQQFLTVFIDALHFIHANEIIHRDIKPSNILFASNELKNPVIADFGICYDYKSPPLDEPIHEKYIDVCTGIYKSPELLLGMTNYSYEIDVWSLGIILTILYSKNFKSVLLQGEGEELDEMNNESSISDLHLLSCLFKNFGTPYYDEGKEDSKADEEDEEEELLWKELSNDEYHFKKFNLKKFKRRPIDELIPICNDDLIKKLFIGMIRYDREKRITSKELYEVIRH
ncbi:CSK1 [Candida oxycetoniae]|uniref:CSK1 n=1 Tax=Candida oxycetoniae TaxID=497107 RepID=A0AAI9SVR5_9ASCO|nr:CSK1 [Candida oxycetoniae]KAI3403629.2 CSK1 [Candida oxycetoniae]